MRIVVEVVKDGQFKVWQGNKCTEPLDANGLAKQLRTLKSDGESYYVMRTVDEWYAISNTLTPNWTSVKIYYWPEGTWCHSWELEQMSHMNFDFAETTVLPGKSHEEIDAIVQNLIKGK